MVMDMIFFLRFDTFPDRYCGGGGLPKRCYATPRGMDGALSKREGVLYWWPFSSKRNDRLQPFYSDINLI